MNRHENANRLAVAFLVLLSPALMAQTQDAVPLKNWAAPLYWQPTPAESKAAQQRVDGAGIQTRLLSAQVATPPANLVFVAMTPCRVVDTRVSQSFPSPFGAPGLTAGPARSFPIQSSTLCSIPLTAQAYSLNVTVVPPGALGYLTIWPTGQTQPNAVTLDDLLGTIVNNAAIVPAGTPNGSISAVVNGTTDLVIDINGYYAAPTDLNSNTGLGVSALSSNTSGKNNTAEGAFALLSNTQGTNNTADGAFALYTNNAGYDNTAIGTSALMGNFSGYANTASGYQALCSNSSGWNNTAVGSQALYNNTTANANTATGVSALYNDTTGYYNTAYGYEALFTTSDGRYNTAVGYQALWSTNGSNNIAIGYSAGSQNTGSGNITIGNGGEEGEDNVTRIGYGQGAFFAAGINGVRTGLGTTTAVLIDGNGQLGTVSSSRRYKEDIQDMGDASSDLLRLRPVTFRYKKPYEDGSKPLDYGLIAEEVADVYPDLVVYGKDGLPETVQYQKLPAMLLNEVQKQDHHLQQQDDTIRLLQEQNRQESETVRALQLRLAALESALSAKLTATGGGQ